MRTQTAQPESMAGSMAGALTLGPMGRQGKGLCLGDYISVLILELYIYGSVFGKRDLLAMSSQI